jgi:hypothetical protein
MRGQHQATPVFRHDVLDVLESVDGDFRNHVGRRSNEPSQLGRDHSQMLARSPIERSAFRQRATWKRDGQVPERDPSTPAKRDVHHVSQAAAQPERRREREPPDQAGEDSSGESDRRLRSRRISTMIGMTERTITMRTTQWMWLEMFGIA